MSAIGTGTGLKDKEEFDSVSCFDSASSFCANAISSKSTRGCDTVTEFVSIRDRAFATGFAQPLMWTMFVVNWDM